MPRPASGCCADPGQPVTDLLLVIGRRLPRRRDSRGYLIVEALVAARRDEDVARLMRGYVGDEEWAELLTRVVAALARTGITAQTGTAQ